MYDDKAWPLCTCLVFTICLGTSAGSQKCSSRTYVVLHATYQASEVCAPLNAGTDMSGLLATFNSTARAECSALKDCTVIGIPLFNVEIHLELRFECSCKRNDDGSCLRKATTINKQLQDAIRQSLTTEIANTMLRLTNYRLDLVEDCDTG
jgi:hypothetical protein